VTPAAGAPRQGATAQWDPAGAHDSGNPARRGEERQAWEFDPACASTTQAIHVAQSLHAVDPPSASRGLLGLSKQPRPRRRQAPPRRSALRQKPRPERSPVRGRPYANQQSPRSGPLPAGESNARRGAERPVSLNGTQRKPWEFTINTPPAALFELQQLFVAECWRLVGEVASSRNFPGPGWLPTQLAEQLIALAEQFRRRRGGGHQGCDPACPQASCAQALR